MKNKKIFGIFNVLDLIIIAVVIVAIVFAGIKIASNRSTVVTSNEVQKETYIEFYVEEVNDFITKHIKEGDLVKDALQSIDLGTVTEVTYGDAKGFEPDSNGRIVTSSKEGYVSAKVRVKTNGYISNSGMVINSYNYYVNKSMEIRVGNVALYVRLSDMEEVEVESKNTDNAVDVEVTENK